MYSKQTVWFLYILHAIPAIYFIISLPSLLVACGLVECLWWQQLQIQLFPLLAVVIPFIALYLQQKGKFYAGYLFVISLVYYVWSFWQTFLAGGGSYLITPNFLLLLALLLLIAAQLFIIGKTTYYILRRPSEKKSKKLTFRYKDLLIIAGIVVVAYVLLRLFLFHPPPITDEDCTNIKNQQRKDACFATLAASTKNIQLCTRLEKNREAMINCFEYSAGYITPSLCDQAVNPGLCYFGIAIVKEELDYCVQSDDNTQCEIIVRSSKSVRTKETFAIDAVQCDIITFNTYYHDLCLAAAAYNQKDIKICKDISGLYQEADCILQTAVAQQDCSIIPKNIKIQKGDSYRFVRDECFSILAGSRKDINLCRQISDKHSSASCIYAITSTSNTETSSCDALSASPNIYYFNSEKDACYYGVAKFKKDVRACSSISSSILKAECIGSIGTIEDCDSIPKDEKIGEDYQGSVRDSCITAIINRDPKVEYCNHSSSTESFNWCVDLTARATRDKEVCSLIQNQQLRDLCIEQAIIAAQDQ